MNTLSSLLKWLGDTIGSAPSTLVTTSKTIVGSINEAVGANPSTLTTTAKTLVGAINEVVANHCDDTGWISLSPYVANGFAARSGSAFAPAYRIKHGVVYFKGQVYSTSAKSDQWLPILTNLPAALKPSGGINQLDSGGCRYYGTPYFMCWENNQIKVWDSASIGVQDPWSGYSLSVMTPYTV